MSTNTVSFAATIADIANAKTLSQSITIGSDQGAASFPCTIAGSQRWIIGFEGGIAPVSVPTCPTIFQVMIDPRCVFPIGSYSALLTLAAQDYLSATITITLTVSPTPPDLNGPTNNWHVEFGQLLRQYGTGIASHVLWEKSRCWNAAGRHPSAADRVGGAQVSACLPGYVNCFPLQIWYASPSQINAVLPSATSTDSGTGAATFQVSAGLTPGPKYTATISYQAPGIFQEGYDCAYPAVCGLSTLKTATNNVLRGSITDAVGKLVSSQNPILAGKEYVLYLTGLGFPQIGARFGPTVYVSLIATTSGKHGVTSSPDFDGRSPCCEGLDQVNFQLPPDLRRAFTPDGVNLPSCGSITGDIATEMGLDISSNVLGQADDSVQVPVLLHLGDLECTP